MKLPTMKIRSAARMISDLHLHRIFMKLNFKRKRVLEVCVKHDYYRKRYMEEAIYKTLDVHEKYNPDYVGDVHELSKIFPKDTFHYVIATEVFEHLYNPNVAAQEIHKVLEYGGKLIMSTRFIEHLHDQPDYYRFTHHSLRYIFRNFSQVHIIPTGNRLVSTWQINNINGVQVVLNLFNYFISKITFNDRCPSGYVVEAIK